MFTLLNRITWVLCICIFIIIWYVDDDLIFLGLVIALWMKYILFSPWFIKESLSELWYKDVLDQEAVNTQSSFIAEEEEGNEDESESISPEVWVNLEIDDEKIEVDIPLQQETIIHDQDTSWSMKQTLEVASYSAASDTNHESRKEREANMLEKFFAENLLAKVWGILVFLWVVFLLSLVYTLISPVTKLLLWFGIGALCYLAGIILAKKWYKQESHIVLGTAILINYLVILAGRYILWSEDSVLSVSLTMLLLVANTVFAIYTSISHESRALLIFAFVIAYINPFLVWDSSWEPYTLLWYTMIVTLWAMYMSHQRKDEILFPLSFVFAAILIIITPWNDGIWWITKLLCINTLWALWLYVSTVFQKTYKYIFEFLIAWVFFLIWIMGFIGLQSISPIELLIMWLSSLSLMWFCYFMMHKWAYLYSIGTFGTILTLSPVILQNWLWDEYVFFSAIILLLFGIMNIWVILQESKDLLVKNIWSIISWLISGSLFLCYMIYVYWEIYFPGTSLGLAFMSLWGIYFSGTYLLIKQIWMKKLQNDDSYQNLVYCMFALWVSLFTISIAFLFAGNLQIMSIVWILEATILLFLASRTKSQKIAIAGIVVFALGVVKLIEIIYLWGSYNLLVSWGLTYIAFAVWLIFTQNTREGEFLSSPLRWVYNFFHIIGIICLGIWGSTILALDNSWEYMLYISLYITSMWILYEKLSCVWLKKAHICAYILSMWIHISLLYYYIWGEWVDMILSLSVFGVYALPHTVSYFSPVKLQDYRLLYIFLWYTGIVSSLSLYHIFDASYLLPLMWSCISYALISLYRTNKTLLKVGLSIAFIDMILLSFMFVDFIEVFSLLWIIASNVALYYASVFKNKNTWYVWLTVFVIWVLAFLGLADSWLSAADDSLIYREPLLWLLTWINLYMWLIFVYQQAEDELHDSWFNILYNIFHVIWVIGLIFWGENILDIVNPWYSLLYYSLWAMLLWTVYQRFTWSWLEKVHLTAYVCLMCFHLIVFWESIWSDNINMTISTVIAVIYALPFTYDYIKNSTIRDKALFSVFLWYIFILSSLYVYELSGVTFIVTLYWWILAFGILWQWISRNVLAMRTIWLYLLSLTASKIFLYDIWTSVDGTISRVVALIVVWILMITLSAMYTRKYGNNLNSEFNISNLFPKNNKESHERYKKQSTTSKNSSKNIVGDVEQERVKVEPKKTKIQTDIESIDITWISWVRIKSSWKKQTVQIRAENLIKISKLIASTYKKTSFKPGELQKAYNMIQQDYKSSLSPAQYKKIQSIVKEFVELWWEIEFITK